ncbi:MAG: hypothetical protein AB2707_10640, partial [Candidatus Thiodiazotropha sp.]
ADVIQLFYHLNKQQTDIYLLDEQGALFQQSLPTESPRFLMRQQRRFLNSLQQLRNLLLNEHGSLLEEPEFHELSLDKEGHWITRSRRVPLVEADDYTELTLVTDGVEADARPLALLFDEREFSRLEYSDDLYSAAADYIHGQRKGEAHYPIYLTSIRLSGFQTVTRLSTVELLNIKKRVEERLNR